ncbi:hypothetical protein QLX08_011611 [Tetragonisca angustula]|uniref:Uncharacterized protein n=1 Tax=Tetragonisca angustula TaxID=166442 RepID=A0AAW0Z8P6_9HYME
MKQKKERNREKNKPYEDGEVLRNNHRAEELLLLSEEGYRMMRGANLTVAGPGRAEDMVRSQSRVFSSGCRKDRGGLDFCGVESGECTAPDVVTVVLPEESPCGFGEA